MIPSIVASELQEGIRRFLYASFPTTTPGFRRDDGGTMLDDLLTESAAIFKGHTLGWVFRFGAWSRAPGCRSIGSICRSPRTVTSSGPSSDCVAQTPVPRWSRPAQA